MQKRFIPTVGSSTSYSINFNNRIYNPHAGHRFAISSSAFVVNGTTTFFDDDGNGNLRTYQVIRNERSYINSSAGTVNYLTGAVVINPINISSYTGDGIKINAVPNDENITTVRNQIIQVADANISVINKNNNNTEATVTLASGTLKVTSASDTGLESGNIVS